MSSIIKPYLQKQPARPFHHRLIMRDYRQIKPPLTQWAAHLRGLLQEYNLRNDFANQDAEMYLSDWFWQAADIFIFAGQFREARDICYAHIQLMLNFNQAYDQKDCLWYAFKSWVNLARIDRLCKQYVAAANKLQAHRHWRDRVFQSPVSISNVVNVAIERVRKEYQIERIKLCFSTHQVQRIIEEFGVVNHSIQNQHAFTIDALILAYVQAGYIHEALHFAEKMKASPLTSELAFIRIQEIRWSYFHEKVEVQSLIDLTHSMLQVLKNQSQKLSDQILSLHLARFLSQLKLTKYASPLLHACLEHAIKLDDDVLKADALALLFTIGVRHYKDAFLEDCLVAHYHETLYPAARATLMRAYPELKYVEINQDFHQLTMLLHDLMLLSAASF